MLLIFHALGKLTASQISSEDSDRKIRLGINYHSPSPKILEKYRLRRDIYLAEYQDEDIEKSLSNDTLDLVFELEKNFDSLLTTGKQASLTLHYNPDITSSKIIDRSLTNIEDLFDATLASRLDSLAVTSDFITPIDIKDYNKTNRSLPDIKKIFGTTIPYFLLLFGFLGILAPSNMLFLKDTKYTRTSPLLRLGIILLLSGMSIAFALLGMHLILEFDTSCPTLFSNLINGLLTWENEVYLLVLSTSVSALVASVAAYLAHKTTSSANTWGLFAWLGLAVFVGLIISLLLASLYALNWVTAFIPYLNVLLFGKLLFSDAATLLSHLQIWIASIASLLVAGFLVMKK